jgi:hypothetical protein
LKFSVDKPNRPGLVNSAGFPLRRGNSLTENAITNAFQLVHHLADFSLLRFLYTRLEQAQRLFRLSGLIR